MRDPVLLCWLLVGHLAGDFMFQTEWMALGKASRLLPLVVHGAVYTAVVTVSALPLGGLPLVAVAVIFFSHIFLDQRWFINRWVRVFNGKNAPGWMNVMVDQAWHAVILAFVVLLS